ncbi:MAG: AAA family ATPase [Tissierellaceae bacterium]|nr:AAA family ATPase [Tissierellaceae bacterium]
MIIKELNLIGFGKFKNRSLQLKEGINLIYGENEAGKSTLHSFIHGMFYGFLKPDAKSTTYTDEHQKYNPWDKSRYAGILSFKYEDKTYRIERDFTKGEENTKVIDEKTGLEITKNMEVGRGRVLQPGIHFFGFNTRVFSNTVFIKQLETKTEDKLAAEVRERLVNVSKSLDENISIDKAIEGLKNKIAEIGTERARTRPYARNLNELSILGVEKTRILSERDKYLWYLEEKERLEVEVFNGEKSLEDLKENLHKVEILDKAKKLNEANELLAKTDELEKQIKELAVYKDSSVEMYRKAIDLHNRIEYIEKNAAESKDELNMLLSEIASLEKFQGDKGNYENINLETAHGDYNCFEELDEEKNSITQSREDSTMEFLRRDKLVISEKVSKSKKLRLVFAIASAIAMVLTINAFLTVEKYLLFGPLTLGFAAISNYFFMEFKKGKKAEEEIEGQISNIQNQEIERNSKISDIEERQKGLLSKYDVATKFDLKMLIDKLQRKHDLKELEMERLKDLSSRKTILETKISQNNIDKEEKQKELKELLKSNGVENLQEFSLALDKRSLYEKYTSELENHNKTIVRILGNKTVDELEEELKGEIVDEKVEILDEDILLKEIDKFRNTISSLNISLTKVEENLNILGRDVSKLVDIEEELDKREKVKLEMDMELEALELAINTIENLSKEIHHEFAPNINEKVGKLIQRVTKDKYRSIRVDESLNITVENPQTGEIVKLNNLSGGTIDQLYFSLRYTITSSMTDHSLPLILDDSFLQYDNNRLRSIMEFLVDISKERQIILFTCHNREENIMNELKAQYNFINLV